MKFERIHIRNFKPFYQTESLEFDPDSDKPLTLVCAKNDVGKTAVLEAIRFCLYGFESNDPKDMRDQCINRKAVVQGSGQTSISLEVHHDGQSYRIIRGHYFDEVSAPEDRTAENPYMKIVVAPGTEDGYIYIDTEEDDEIDDAEDFVSDLLPKDTVQFFMFDGDRIEEFAKKLEGSDPGIRDAIEQILGIREIQYAIQDMDNIAISHYRDLYNDASSEAEVYRETKEKREEVAGKINSLEVRMEEIDQDIRETEEEHSSISQDLAEAGNKEEKYKRLTKSKVQLKGLDEVPNAEEVLDGSTIEELDDCVLDQITEVRVQQQKLYSKFGPAAAVVAAKSIESDIPDQYTLVPDTIKKTIMERSDECHVCGQSIEIAATNGGVCDHCGRPHVTREDLKDRLEEMRQDATDDALILSDIVDEVQDLEDEYELSQQALEQRFVQLGEHYSDLEKQREKLENKIARLENELEKAMDQTKREALKEHRDQLKNRIDRLREEKGEKRVEIQNARERLRELDDRLDDIEGATDREKRYKQLMNASEQTKTVFELAKDHIVDDQRKMVEDEASNLFMDMTNKPGVYDGLDIDQDYQLRLKVGEDIRDLSEQDPSQGARQIIAYAFNAGVARSASWKAPFVIDTPTGRLDDEHKTNLFDNLSNFGDQIVVLYQPREMNKGDIQDFEDDGIIQNHYEIRKGDDPEVSEICPLPENQSVCGDSS
ncbi:AAA family ATPase [Halomicrococcus sp. NG-SE-24]|uniref:AAA family ATPase n=1 Tax=Halomicrococcus sp. NG-SE-24 TaxID=3436928 RepID=UPI003D95B0F5